MKQSPLTSRFSIKPPSLGFLKRQGRGFDFAHDIVAELKRVTWPSRLEANRLTTIVIAVSLAVGALLAIVDFIFYWVINGLIVR